jgi:flagellar hook-associated protein 1 FlgK
MPDFLSTGVSGLIAFRRALDVTGHNISNVATEGYSRQQVTFQTREAQAYGNGYVGSGVQVDTVRRIYDDFLALSVRTSSSSYERLAAYSELAGRVDDMFASSTTGIAASLQKFTNSIQQVASNPASTSARQVMLSQAQSLAGQFQQYDERLSALSNEVESRIKSEAAEITTLARGIAQLNSQIKAAYGQTGHPPNDLLDQRDRLLDQLSTHVNVNTAPQDGGVINVFIGNGQPLVLGETPATLTTSQDAFDPTQSHIVIQSANGSVDVTTGITGGTLGGLIDVREEVLDPARNALGRMTVALTDVVNAQNRSGNDLNGNLGQDIFSVGGVEVLDHRSNTGDAAISVTRADIGGLTEKDYILERTSGGWAMRDAATGQSVALTGSGTPADPLVADGLEIVIDSGTAATGDEFMIRPTRNAAASFDLEISDPAQIAAAAPVRFTSGPNNTSGATMSLSDVADPDNPALRTSATIQFTSATTYSINGAGSYTYTPGSPIQVNGLELSFSSNPASGDSFTIANNTGATGDNSNALKLANALNERVLDGGSQSIGNAIDGFVGKIGVMTQQAQISADAQQIVNSEAIDARDNVSGVNLDEEAANLLKYQQAYQAAAQLISIANTLFQSLLAATDR